ncbi:hypothetical protein [Actinokineospora sp.]|uniref:hypothetical protein n=1 Tax=Actinokineospora sp. TaxID=1872133 RepID=UPI004037CFD8
MDDTWKSVQLREAEAQLDLAVVSLDATLAEIGQKYEQQEEQETGLTDEDIRLISEHARSAEAPKELRDLQTRIDQGDLTWRDVTSGRAAGDPGVRQALEAGLPQLQQAYTMLDEGHSVDDVIDAGTHRPPRRDDEDGDGIVLRNDAW